MVKECIILAGGLGTRLRSVVSDVPKVLAEVNHKPFLHYIISNAVAQHMDHIVLSTGYLHEKVEEFVHHHFPELKVSFAVEEEPLGTGGGIAKALMQCNTEEILILNGDTFFNINYSTFYALHQRHQSGFSIALKPMEDFERYGTVNCDEQHRITSFNEKKYMQHGLINAGVYLLNKSAFLKHNWPEKFSMEKDFMEKYYAQNNMTGFAFDEYFIDIGVPEDYAKAQEDFKTLFR